MRLSENGQFVQAIVPINLATGANNGDWVSMANYNHLSIVVSTGVGASGEDITLTVNQATDNAGTSSKALTFTDIYEKEGSTALSAVGTATKQTQSAAQTYNSTSGGENEQLIVVEIDADDLDADGGFDFVQLTIADVGSTSQIGSAIYYLSEPRHGQEAPVSALS
jgi:hypothetical protein